MRAKAARAVLRRKSSIAPANASVAPPKAVAESAVLTKAVVRAAHLLSFSQRELAHVLGVSEATAVSRQAAPGLW